MKRTFPYVGDNLPEDLSLPFLVLVVFVSS